MTTGMIMPPWSLVAALNSLQKPMMFTPCWPSAGPTGGAGLACPAGICNLISPVFFFAITILSSFFDLPILQLDRRVAAENVHRDLQLAARRIDLFDDPVEVHERPVRDLHILAHRELDLRTLRVFALGNLRLDDRHFFRSHRHR